MRIRDFWGLLKTTLVGYDSDDIPRHGAALSFYTLFSIAPLLMIVIAIAGALFGEQAAQGRIVSEISNLVGDGGARAVQSILANASVSTRSIPAAIIGVVTFFMGATAAFTALQGALNAVWNVQPHPKSPVTSFLKNRLLSFGMVLGIGFLLLVSLLVSAGINALSNYLGNAFPGAPLLWEGVNSLLSFVVTTALFAMIFIVLPDVILKWRDVWRGAVITALFFTIGKFLIGLYLGHSSVASSYGAAGSLVVILFWVYYTSQIILLGAEFTQAYVNRFGARIRPAPYAVLLETGPADALPPPEAAPERRASMEAGEARQERRRIRRT